MRYTEMLFLGHLRLNCVVYVIVLIWHDQNVHIDLDGALPEYILKQNGHRLKSPIWAYMSIRNESVAEGWAVPSAPLTFETQGFESTKTTLETHGQGISPLIVPQPGSHPNIQ